ncbi:hypothetical protein BMW23_0238 [Bodo saltans virus]|jgi:hypothetical protein|uniref:Uncharacterized protein n=1 Tax=Bodo saltans virus TaxID=2024608 RepID=A0A2H4UTW5_9VIRU|nr:hypothetical protein QJ851_gp0233 [Bodo saltans virus]ATZ80296.1 hypothetical protein BMW23_0238 [Bodo saltans virus]
MIKDKKHCDDNDNDEYRRPIIKKVEYDYQYVDDTNKYIDKHNYQLNNNYYDNYYEKQLRILKKYL